MRVKRAQESRRALREKEAGREGVLWKRGGEVYTSDCMPPADRDCEPHLWSLAQGSSCDWNLEKICFFIINAEVCWFIFLIKEVLIIWLFTLAVQEPRDFTWVWYWVFKVKSAMRQKKKKKRLTRSIKGSLESSIFVLRLRFGNVGIWLLVTVPCGYH